VIFCDADGNEVNGDASSAWSRWPTGRKKKLVSDTVVVTSMSNLGFMQAMKKAGINVEITDVGDRYVIERMRAGNFNVGGEQSGHIIFLDYATTGDGIITALHVLKHMRETGRPLAELAGFMTASRMN
jgi:phosphoglucosamine mutase